MIKFKIKQEGPQIDDEKLIEEVSKNPFLYDTRNTDYRNLPLRATMWSFIAKNLNIDDQNIVQKRWKVLREKFSLAYRKQVLEEINSNWPLYDSLTFLEPFVNLKPETKKHKSDDSYSSINSSYSVAKSPLDEQVLIQLVKERPLLFDKKHEDFRVANARKKAWDEISALVGWDVDTLQRRWRVMRDRFVRELRKSKNIQPDSQLNCSTFFREMLFLTHHVKSKRYEVEAHFDDSEVDSGGGYEYEPCDDKIYTKKEREYDQTVEIISDAEDIDNSIKYDETVLEEHIEVQDDEYIEEIIECTQNEHDELLAQEGEGTEIIALEEITKEQWIKQENASLSNIVNPKKRRASSQEEKVHSRPKKSHSSESQQFTIANSSESIDNDEDIRFGNTLGCMLKRIPPHLKTAVKLKLLQSLADFEAEHRI